MGWELLSQGHVDTKGFGITTGTCVAACVLASALHLNEEENPQAVEVMTPQGLVLKVEVEPYAGSELPQAPQGASWYRVQKDSGDDPDVTDKTWIYALVCEAGALSAWVSDKPVAYVAQKRPPLEQRLVGGPGVGRVTLDGLKVSKGEPAINPGPREMVVTALELAGVDRPVDVIVSIPEGVRLASRTFNPRLGVEGGISVLGTTGFVRPMSQDALVESLLAEVPVRLNLSSSVMLTFGASGEVAASRLFGISKRFGIQMSNFVGPVFDETVRLGAQHVLIAGHPGKLVKLAASIMNTHSAQADGRAEILACHAALQGASRELVRKIYEATTTEVALELIESSGISGLWEGLAQRIQDVMEARALRLHDKTPQVGVAFLRRSGSLLGASENLEDVVGSFPASDGACAGQGKGEMA